MARTDWVLLWKGCIVASFWTSVQLSRSSLQVNPLGREVTLLSAIMLNVGTILGSGIFSVPGVILKSVGSVGLLLAFWIIIPLVSLGTYVVVCRLHCDSVYLSCP